MTVNSDSDRRFLLFILLTVTSHCHYMTDIEQAKKQLREDVLKKRVGAHRMLRERASLSVRDHFLSHIKPGPDACIAGYWPLSGELDPIPLLTVLHENNCRIALPAVGGHTDPLLFRNWHPRMELVEGYSGTKQPPAAAGEIVPDVLIVPLIAFDRAGYRLGYGGGFYDRTLHHLRASKKILAVGLAYAVQQVPIVPHEGRDEKLDWVITEEGAIHCG